MHAYHAFGLNIQSQLYLPELPVCSNPSFSDILIHEGPVPEAGLPSPDHTRLFFQTQANTFWLHVPHVARFLIEEGKKITVEPIQRDDMQTVRLFLLGSCMGALLMQRGLYLLHANAIRIGDCCISFAGRSGIGKSTLAAAFVNKGYEILTDDVCAIDEQGRVIPGYPQIKLWEDAIAHLSIPKTPLRQIRAQVSKFAYPLERQFYTEPLPLKVIYLLGEHNQEDFLIEQIEGVRKFQPIKNNTYRRTYFESLFSAQAQMKRCSLLAQQTGVVRLTRPNVGFNIEQLLEKIEADLNERGLAHVC